MDASDMVDILHYFFEEDNKFDSGEQAEAVSGMRTELYKLYERTYAYGVKSSNSASNRAYVGNGATDGFDGLPFDPENAPVKPFVPSTDFNPESSNPFGGVLDVPMG
jgi:hypothetical protein